MYDYLVVGSGLYGAIFAHEAKVHGKSVLVVDKRPRLTSWSVTVVSTKSKSSHSRKTQKLPIRE